MTTYQLVAIAVAVGVTLLFCGLPVMIAFGRRHPDRRTIAKLSPLALLSFALWFALILWAATDRKDDSIVARYIDRIQKRNLGPWIVGGLVFIGLAGTAASLYL
ncbi:hypothetical protein [Aurantiacibacter aquimixticola]|uniref:Uncharacterized protein n=1 Tax=Aurantiacibacter aquimixticola TaxID=1958945 RepID=A0A419RR36_9SPHN|nr:hypothetical protein [Aurantiacibacter aquimixticola]RJY08248.1 hypothetical protein D6201_01740 [Aurantiacibacter aquimixticola]